MAVKHLDLFSGIGGFAYAVDQVWDDVEHIFCDIEPFCREILNKHWEGAKTYHDIREITDERADIVTGGFPCQPFSQAGKRRGTADNRYLWPEMFRVIQIAKPQWVVAENVPGIINIQDGVVFEQVCTDLEAEGYEVQAFVIPALAVNAPHRRDRLWIVANSQHPRWNQAEATRQNSRPQSESSTRQELPVYESTGADSLRSSQSGRDKTTTHSRRPQQGHTQESKRSSSDITRRSWANDWVEVAAEFCGVDDGLPNRVDRIKALGNAIVPQIAVEILELLKNNGEDTK